MDISPTGDYILINALGFTLLIRVTPISKLKYYLIPIHLMKLKNTTNQSSNEEKKKETEDLEDIRKIILQDPSTIPQKMLDHIQQFNNKPKKDDPHVK